MACSICFSSNISSARALTVFKKHTLPSTHVHQRTYSKPPQIIVSCRDTSENVYSSLIRILPSLSVFLPRMRTRVHASFFVSICSPLSSRTWRTDKDARSCESAPEVASRHACPWLNSSSEYRWQLVRRLPDGSMVCTVCVCVCVCVV